MLVANSRLLVVNGLDVYALVCIFCFFGHPGWNCQDCIGKPGRCLNTIHSSLAQGVWHKMEEEIIVVSRTVLCVGVATFVPSPASHAWMRPGPQRCAWCAHGVRSAPGESGEPGESAVGLVDRRVGRRVGLVGHPRKSWIFKCQYFSETP